jgi:transcriptional regulator with XRE-family HTH domain
MSFDAIFSDLRKRRRIPMRLFEQRCGINPSYIHGIEKEGLLPSSKKLEQLAAVFVEVAAEQGAADPEEDGRRLFRERERTAFVERLGFDPELAEVLVSLRELDAAQRGDMVGPLGDAISLVKDLSSQERGGLATLIHETVGVLDSLGAERRREVALELAKAIGTVLDDARQDLEETERPGSDSGPDRTATVN